MKSIEQMTNEAVSARAAWLEDVLAGLLTNGVTKDEIEVQEHAGNRTVVCVRGVPKYEWRFHVTPPLQNLSA